MGKLFAFRDKLRQLTPEKIGEQLLIIVKENEATAVDMNTAQLFSGKDSQGINLPDYSEKSVEVFGKPKGPWRLFDTGDFYRGFFANTDRYPIVFESKGIATGKIADALLAKGRNPDHIYGLQKQNLAEFTKSYVLEGLQKSNRNFLGV